MANYAIMSFHKLHKTGGDKEVSNAYEHNMRIVAPTNADPTLYDMNREIIEANGRTWRQIIDAQIEAQRSKGAIERAVRRDAVQAYEVMMTYSREMKDKFSLNRWIEKNVEWLDREFNPPDHTYTYIDKNGRKISDTTDNVKHVVLHMDEEVPHLHALVVPIDDHGKLNAGYYTGTRLKTVNLQNSYAKEMDEFGLSRGEVGSIATPEEKGKYYSKIVKAVASELPEPHPDESLEEYRARANEQYQTMLARHNDEMQKMKREQIKKYSVAREDVEAFKKEKSIFHEPLHELASAYGKARLNPTDIRDIKDMVKSAREQEAALNENPDLSETMRIRADLERVVEEKRRRDRMKTRDRD